MYWVIKWTIGCMMIIFLGLGFLIGTYVTLTVHVVQDHDRGGLAADVLNFVGDGLRDALDPKLKR